MFRYFVGTAISTELEIKKLNRQRHDNLLHGFARLTMVFKRMVLDDTLDRIFKYTNLGSFNSINGRIIDNSDS